MKRSSLYLITSILFITIWLYFYINRFTYQNIYQYWILVIPWYSLICLGCYCLYALGSGILFFNDCPNEIKKLEKVYFFYFTFLTSS